jgi:DNA-binding Lrp family transcriptional regulator
MERIGGTVGDRDYLGRPLPLERKIIVKKIRKYLWGPRPSWPQPELKEELERLRSAMGIPRPCVEQALEIYRQALKKEMPISAEAMAAAALYMACRMMKMPRPLDEFVRYTKTTKEKIARCYRLLLSELNVKVPISDPALYISRIAGQLKLSGEVVKTAIDILQKAKKARITAGKDPAGLAAAAVYIAALMHGDNRTQKDFAAAAGVAEVTVRNRYKELAEVMRSNLALLVKKVEVNGKTYVVKVIGGHAEIEGSQSGKPLLRIRITAEVGRVEGGHIVDRVVREYTITYGRYGDDNEAKGFAYARADAPGGREADAERLAAVIKALTGREPRMSRRSNGRIDIICGRAHLESLRLYTELAEVIERWLKE